MSIACPLIPDNEHRENCNGLNFSFIIPISLIPPDSVIHLGDTVSIYYNFSFLSHFAPTLKGRCDNFIPSNLSQSVFDLLAKNARESFF